MASGPPRAASRPEIFEEDRQEIAAQDCIPPALG
jgi:hypothetical protein